MAKATLLYVDDDKDLRTVVNQYLDGEGYTVVNAESVQTAIEKTQTTPVDVVLLDLGLPDGEGLSLIPQMKSKGAAIIIVSGKSDTTEKIVGLEMGADDYITKPFEMRELSARIKAVLRRTENNVSVNDDNAGQKKYEKIRFSSGWWLDRTQYQLFDDKNKSAGLTTGEFKLLEALVLSPNRALSREHLFDLTRDGNFDAYDRAIDIQIARLRKKIQDDPKSPHIIKTVRGVGYMFCGETEAA